MANIAKSSDKVWEPKDPQKSAFIAIFWFCRTHYNFFRSFAKNFDICHILVKVPGPCEKSRFGLVALFEPRITYLSSFLIYT